MKIAVVLSGGVDRGAYQAGALHALSFLLNKQEHDFTIVGTSIGAINGLFLAKSIYEKNLVGGTKELVKTWKDMKKDILFHSLKSKIVSFFLVAKGMKMLPWMFFLFIATNLLILLSLLGVFPLASIAKIVLSLCLALELITMLFSVFMIQQNALLSHKGIQKIIEKGISKKNHGKKFHLIVNAVNLNGTVKKGILDYESVFHFTNFEKKQELQKALLASSAMPGIFPSIEIQHALHVDGGVKNNTPLNYAIEKGAELIIIISPHPEQKPSKENYTSTMNKLLKVGDIMIYDSIATDLKWTKRINKWIERVENIQDKRLQSKIKAAIGLQEKRCIQIIEIKPSKELHSWFQALYHKPIMEEYIKLGFDDAVKVKKQLEKILQ